MVIRNPKHRTLQVGDRVSYVMLGVAHTLRVVRVKGSGTAELVNDEDTWDTGLYFLDPSDEYTLL